MRITARGLLAALLCCVPASAQYVATPSLVAKFERAEPECVRVEFRVLTVSGKESRAAVAKLFTGKGEGTAFLSADDLKAVLEKSAADPTATILQAPRLVASAGEPATVKVVDTVKFTTGLSTKVVNGKAVFVPTTEAVEVGTVSTVTATPSADGKFVELKLAYHDKRVKADVPMVPVTTLIAPEKVGGKTGEPVPFTQYIQVPAFDEAKADRIVTLPDGGTVAVKAGTRTLTRRVESKVPGLGDVPYLGRLFRNVGVREEECEVVVFATAERVKVAAPPVVRAAATDARVGVVTVAAVCQQPQPGDEVKALVAAYRRACEQGKTDDAMRLAVRALAADPTCFGK